MGFGCKGLVSVGVGEVVMVLARALDIGTGIILINKTKHGCIRSKRFRTSKQAYGAWCGSRPYFGGVGWGGVFISSASFCWTEIAWCYGYCCFYCSVFTFLQQTD